MKEILELLKQGEMLEDIRSSSSQPIPASVETSPPSLGNRGGRANKQKTSRFKPTRSQSRPNPSSPTVSESSPPVTPVSHAGRSSPKVPSSPLDAMERQPSNSLVPPRGGNATLQPPTAPSSSNLMVVDSPSFRHLAPITPTAPSPAIMDSPSFRPPTVVAPSSFLPESSRGVTRPDRPPTVIRDVSERGGGGKDQKDLSEARKPNSNGGQKLSRFLAERM
jgi:hypothetical protein